MSRLSLLPLITMLACSGNKDDTTTDTETDTDTTDTDTTDTETTVTDSAEYTDDCGDTPPVLISAVPSPGLDGADPIVGILINVTDADGDLHLTDSVIWYDSVVDGVIDTSVSPQLSAALDFTGSVAPCGLPDLEITLNLPVLDVSLELETEYEFGMAMVDAAGNPSNLLVFTICTPNAAGQAGNCNGTIVETGDTGIGDTGTSTTGDTGVDPQPTGDTGIDPQPTGDTGVDPQPTGDTGVVVADSDGDGIPDSVEGNTDFDADGTPNYLDVDSDNDGHLDSLEGTGDADNDGSPNFLDLDSDGNTIPDIQETEDDLDGDGILNFLDDDTDGDGILDIDELGIDVNSDGLLDYLDVDSPPQYQDDVLPIFTANCNFCHLSGGASGGFSMSYATLIAASNDVSTMPRIDVGGDINNSYVWHKLSGTQGTVGGAGGRMPQGGPFLGAGDMQVIEAWIEGGAHP